MQKKTVKLSVFFELLGSAHAKAACRMLMKLTPGLKSYLAKVLVTLNIFSHNIEIKKIMIFGNWFLLFNQDKLLTKFCLVCYFGSKLLNIACENVCYEKIFYRLTCMSHETLLHTILCLKDKKIFQ